ncbi:MAG TPA: peptidylprolyl isomerase [Steroidobacteraceae bacterium]|nr:peptidylprolyl isomerase [Steroidobacteraceae bacterium]
MTVNAPPTLWSRLLREPLLLFLLLGAALFALDYVLAAGEEDPALIRIDAAVDAELRAIYFDDRGREPDSAELEVLRQRWIDNEVLYREGLALRLDRGDSAIRARVIFKALNVVQANLQLPAVDEAELRAWFAQKRSRYDQPPRIDFQEAVIVGTPDAAEVARFVAALNSDTQPDLQSGLRVFRDRPRPTIVASFGAPFAAALDTLALDRWHVVVSSEGPRAIRVESRTEGADAGFDTLRDAVLLDWRDQRMQELRTEAVRNLARQYRIQVTATDEPLPVMAASEAAPGVDP